MSSATFFSAFKTWLTANWSETSISWENEQFDQPTPTAYPVAPAAWIEVEPIGSDFDRMSIGSGVAANERWQEDGSVMIHCFVQAGVGSLIARENAESIAMMLRGLELPGNIRFRNLSIGGGAAGDENGKWWKLTLSADWVRG
jgi:hypothetical protein